MKNSHLHKYFHFIIKKTLAVLLIFKVMEDFEAQYNHNIIECICIYIYIYINATREGKFSSQTTLPAAFEDFF